jgi:hypothetical protein
MIEPIEDPTVALLKRKREIERAQEQVEAAMAASASMDEKELAEREEAARAYSRENEQHFVDYLNDCVNQSVQAMREIRRVQAHCYEVYKENEPVNYQKKDDWQSRVVVPKPFAAVQFGASAIKKAFTPKFLSLDNVKNAVSGEFWQKVMENQLNEQGAKFVLRFTDATTMALAIGLSMEMIPRWVPGRGLEYVLIEPWKIHREPDALSRDCQSGLYWIHQEWLDWFVLKQGETNGRYFDVARVQDAEQTDPANDQMTKEAIAARKEMLWERSKYRKMVLTSEFWGVVLDSKANLLLPNATYTVAANRVIQRPKATTYQQIRWPGIAFSPLPDLLKFGGRGLLEGIVSVWEAMNNLMCLHQDNMMWVVNPMTEINIDALVDPMDAEGYPGKEYLVRDTVSGQQAVRTVERRHTTNEVLANMQYYDQNFQRGSFVTDAVQGLPGYRKDMTYREAAMNLDQAMGVYSLMGENIEQGAIEAIVAGAELTYRHATYADYERMFTQQDLERFGIRPDATKPNGVAGVPVLDGSFHVSGIQALMRENETITNLKQVVIPLAESPRFGRYIKPYNVLKSLETRVNLRDEKVFVTENEALQIEAEEYEALAQQKKAALEAQDIAQAQGIADLAAKLAPAGGSRPPAKEK